MSFTIVDAIILLLAAFVPSFIYLIWIRNTERFAREPYGRLLRVFTYGAIISVIIAVVAELIATRLFSANIQRFYNVFGNNPNLASLALAIVIAPLVEELAKSIGVSRVRRFMFEIEDGLIYGAAAGLGFAATENLLYEGSAFFAGGPEAFIQTAVVRSLSSALLHGSASAVVGLGIARSIRQGKSWLPYYFGGVLMHASFNLFASLGDIYTNQADAPFIGLMAAFIIAIGGISIVRSKIRALDIQSAMSGRR
jgi:RsiW-degrading membrane proteinase PrsW (M82 family)